MIENRKVNSEDVKDRLEQDIVSHLKSNGESLYGEIFKELQISTSKGQEAIFSLLRQGEIMVDKSSIIKLSSD